MMSKMLIQDGLDKAFIVCFGSLIDTLKSLENTTELGDTLEMDLIKNKKTKNVSSNSISKSNTNFKQITTANEINQDFKVLSISDSSKLANPKFSVQIGVFKNLISLENPISKYPLLYFKGKNNYKYFVGKYENLSSAINMKKLLVLDGLSDSFIICFGTQKESVTKNSNTFNIEENNILDELDTTDLSLEVEKETGLNLENLDGLEKDQFEGIEDGNLDELDTTDLSLEVEKETGLNLENLDSLEKDQFEGIEDGNLDELDTTDLSLEVEKETGLNLENLDSLEKDRFEGIEDGSVDTLPIIINKISLDSLRKLDSIKIINEKSKNLLA